MKPPKSVKVCGHDVAIEFDTLSDCVGIYDFNKGNQFIKLDKGIKGTMLADTVKHEIDHVIYFHWLQEGDDEERTVSAFATGWTAVMVDNPVFREWWTGLFE